MRRKTVDATAHMVYMQLLPRRRLYSSQALTTLMSIRTVYPANVMGTWGRIPWALVGCPS